MPELRRTRHPAPVTQTTALRIGTWNLEGRWTADHPAFMVGLDCDVWLATEVRRDTRLDGHQHHLTAGDMAPGRAWAGVLSRDSLTPLPDPHPASAMAIRGGTTYCSSVLPWRGSGGADPWVGADHASRTTHTVDSIRARLRRGAVWGGDFNHALSGPEYAGSLSGRAPIQELIDDLALVAPTAAEPHRIEGLLSIDHVTVPTTADVVGTERHDASRLSDHDGYVVTAVH